MRTQLRIRNGSVRYILSAGEAADFPTEEYALVYDNAVRCMPDALDADITSAEVFRMDVYNSERHPLVKVFFGSGSFVVYILKACHHLRKIPEYEHAYLRRLYSMTIHDELPRRRAAS